MRVLMVDVANQTPYYVYPLCEALAEAGCRVGLVTAPFTYDNLRPAGFPVREWFARAIVQPPMRRFRWLRLAARLLEYPFDWLVTIRHIARTRPHIVHVQWAMVPFIDVAAFRAVRYLGSRLVFTVHDLQPRYGGGHAMLSVIPLCRLADELIVHTNAGRNAICAESGISPAKVHIMPSGSPVDWAGSPVPRDLARASLNLPREGFLLLFFGGIKAYKRLDLLLHALPRVIAQHPDTRLLIAGRLSESFGPYQETIDRLGLKDHVIHRPGYVPDREVANYFGAADVVVLPYANADLSAVMMTAYTFGRPIVAANTGGLQEMVERDKTGYLASPHDHQAFADAIARLLGSVTGAADGRESAGAGSEPLLVDRGGSDAKADLRRQPRARGLRL